MNITTKVAILHTPQISRGTARTKGHGKTVRVLAVLADPSTFKTLNSRHTMLRDFGTVRVDYGMIRGKSARVIAEAQDYVADFNFAKI